MSKGAVGLVAGYWPEDVYRYLATPGLALDEALVARPARRRAAAPAILASAGVVTYQDLASRVDRSMAGILGLAAEPATRIAVAVGDPLDALVVLLAAVRARRTILLLDPSAPAAVQARHLRRFGADLLVADAATTERAGAGGAERLARSITVGELERADAQPPTRSRVNLKAPAVALAVPGGNLAYHSHASLLAGALSWSTFLGLKEDDVLLALSPLSTWEGLYSALPALFRGAAIAVGAGAAAGDLVGLLERHRPRFALLPFADAARLAAERAGARALGNIQGGLFVSVTGPFRAGERRRLRALAGTPVLTVYGRADAGPALASHPEWFLDEAVGIPVTNVDVWPLHPATGNPLEVPWEAVEHGEIGVKSPMAAMEYETPEEMAERVRGGWLRTRLVATMDPSGFFHLLSGGGEGGAG